MTNTLIAGPTAQKRPEWPTLTKQAQWPTRELAKKSEREKEGWRERKKLMALYNGW